MWIKRKDFARRNSYNKQWFLVRAKGFRDPILVQFYRSYSKTQGTFFRYDPAPHTVRMDRIPYE